MSGRIHCLVHECNHSQVILSFRPEGSKDCVKREKAIKVAQLLIKKSFEGGEKQVF